MDEGWRDVWLNVCGDTGSFSTIQIASVEDRRGDLDEWPLSPHQQFSSDEASGWIVPLVERTTD